MCAGWCGRVAALPDAGEVFEVDGRVVARAAHQGVRGQSALGQLHPDALEPCRVLRCVGDVPGLEQHP